MVGLPGTISRKPYELTAEALEPLQANFIPGEAFLEFLLQHGDAALKAAEMLNHIYYATLAEVRCLGLSVNTAGKLARFLLDLPTFPSQNYVRSTLTMTHNEIAERIGSSRETVTRLFADFRRKRYLEVHGSTVMFLNRSGLENLLDSGRHRLVTKDPADSGLCVYGARPANDDIEVIK
jgi:CRP/FNR family transcriptional regulator